MKPHKTKNNVPYKQRVGGSNPSTPTYYRSRWTQVCWLFFMAFGLGGVLGGCASSKGKSQPTAQTTIAQADEYLATQLPAVPAKAPWQTEGAGKELASEPPSIPVTIPADESLKATAWLDSVRKANLSIKYARGYRVQVYSGPDRALANKAKETVYRQLDGQEVYLTYRQPDFKVHVGNYLNRLEGTIYQQKLAKYFSNTLLIPEEVLLR